MDRKFSVTSSFALFLMLAFSANVQSKVFNIIKYGATPNGDITKALTNAWKDACTSTKPSRVLVPRGTYKLKQVDLRGPCKSPIKVQVDGTIRAPEDPNKFNEDDQWIKFGYINFFTLLGSGTFDGRGETAWKHNDCGKQLNCKKLSMNFGLGFLNNSIIKGITSKDSKHFHVNVFGCNNVTFTNFTITAPATSPNTDGIHIGRSSEIKITNSKISTGDDCISLGDGSRQVTIQNVICGPGHGISIGSLGRYTEEEPVEGVTVRNCILNNTDNGVRIKTWPGTQVISTSSHLRFEDIIMLNVSNPVIIDQEYCPWNQCNKKTPSKIKISKVSFKNIKGTSATQEGVTLICSSGVPCERVQLKNIDLRTINGTAVSAKCINVKPRVKGKAPICSA